MRVFLKRFNRNTVNFSLAKRMNMSVQNYGMDYRKGS